MKRILVAALAAFASLAFGATTVPLALINPAGSTSGQAIVSTGAGSAPAWGNVTANSLAPVAANTVIANFTASAAAPVAFTMPTCSTAGRALQYSGSGIVCTSNYALTTGTLAQFSATTSAQLAGVVSDETGSGALVFATGAAINPTSIGATTPGTGAFTNLSATGTLTGIPGRLLNIQVFTTGGTYTPTSGATKAIVELVGGGGGGGGTPATSASQNALGQGGNAGAYALIWIPSGLSSQTVTIGAAGAAGSAGAAGGNGGSTSFGSLASCSGGNGGAVGSAISVFPAFVTYNTTAATCSGTATFLKNIRGALAFPGFLLQGASFIPGNGGSTPLGSGAQWLGGTTGIAASGFGSGGLGAAAGASSAALAGGAAAAGVVVVYEYQ